MPANPDHPAPRPGLHSRLWDGVIGIVAGHRRWLAVLWLLIAASCAGQLGKLRIDNTLEVWDLAGPEADSREQRYRRDFGQDELIVVAFPARGDPIGREALEHLRDIHQSLETFPCVKEAISLWGYLRDSRGLVPGDPLSPADLDSLREEVEASPFFEGELIRRRGKVLAIHLSTTTSSPESLRQLKSALDRLQAREAQVGRPLHWGGVPAVSMVLDEASRQEVQSRFPLGVVAGCFVGWLAGISIGTLLALLLVAGSAVAIAVGSLVLMDQTMNMVLSILPSMVFFMTMAYGVHVVHAMRGPHRTHDPEESLRSVARPLRDASLTTALGLLSQVSSDFRVLRTMGLHGALGVMAGVIGGYLVLPLLLTRTGPIRPRAWKPLQWVPPGLRWEAWLLLVVAMIIGTFRVETRMDPLEFLPAGHSLNTSFRWIETNLTGLSPFDLVLEFEKPRTTLEGLREIEELESRIGQLAGVTNVMGPVEILKRFRQNSRSIERLAPEDYRLPESQAEIDEFLEAEGESARMLSRFVFDEGRSFRIQVRSTARETGEFEGLRRQVMDLVHRSIPGAHAAVHGSHARIKRMEEYLLDSQFRSLFLSWILVSLILMARAPTWRIGLLAIPPNTLPLFLVFATMGFGGIPLDIGTVMVTSLAAGMAVDDTFHYLSTYWRSRQNSIDHRTAIREALEHEGPAVLQTSAFTGALFLCLTTSAFLPIARFGFLSLVAVSGGILLELTLLPALLTRFDAADPGTDT